MTFNLGVAMRIEMVRTWDLRELPRARGSRTSPVPSGARMALIIQAHAVAETWNLARYMETLTRQIGPRAVTLTGNGNAYYGCILEAVRPDHTDLKAAAFEAEFVQEIG